MTRGRTAWAVVAALALLGAGWWASRSLRTPDLGSFHMRQVLFDVVAAQDDWIVLEAPPDAPPRPTTLTPLVDQHADVADKAAIRMSPPCAIAFDVPRDEAQYTLRAAAGADSSVPHGLPPGLPKLGVLYSVEVDGVEVWSERYEHQSMTREKWDPDLYRWRHVGGRDGIAVRAGQRVTLRTRFAPDQDLSALDTQGGLALGFGGVVLEHEWTGERRAATPATPNILYVVMDTQRVDRLGCYGNRRGLTPHIDTLAARGTLFEEAYATSSWTWPSTASLLTGLIPDEHGVTGNESCTLAYRLRTLAEVLARRGYTTAAFSGNPLIVGSRQFDQGFEHFDGSVPDFRMSDELVPPAIEWLRANASRRFFMYLHLVDPHVPHRPHPDEVARLGLGPPPPGWPEQGHEGLRNLVLEKGGLTDSQRAYMEGLYDASVATGDRWIGAFLAELERLGLTEKTVICFTADHGEGLFDHGMFGHGHSVYGEEVHVPLLFAGPGVDVGRRVAGTVSNRHAATTLASFGSGALDVREPDRVHLLRDGATSGAVTMTHRGARGKQAGLALYGLRRDGLSLHWRDRATEARSHLPPGPERARGASIPDAVDLEQLALFDLRADPHEMTDLVAAEPERARALWAQLTAELRAARAHAPRVSIAVGGSGLATLRANGYAGD